MPLAAGTHLGPYQITEQIGVGGMGEVYRARDTNLGRDVAIKVLPEAFAQDADRLARFEREAKTLASLSHPNIAIVHGFEKAGEIRALVMELVEGPTLADLIEGDRRRGESLDSPVAGGSKDPPPRRSIPTDEAVSIARQIAEALEAAHEQGIVHRDLKPANVKVRDDGTVKVLDFGLAKVFGPPEGGPYVPDVGAGFSRPTASMSPTITTPAMTQIGVILGTAAYMAPEQARGKPVDKRSDIWAFGCVLFEMLAGTRAFDGEDATDTIAAVVRAEPKWDALPADVPSHLRLLLQRCLEKDRKKRIGDIAGALFVLAEPGLTAHVAPGASPPPEPARWRRSIPLIAVVATAIVVGVATSMLRPSLSSPSVTRFPVRLPEGQQFTNAGRPVLTIAPDGTRIVYVANQRLFLRSMSESTPREIPGSAEPEGITTPAFSPGGESIAYISVRDRALKRISVEGGAAVKVAPMENASLGVSWSDDGIIFGQRGRGIMRVSPNGGKPDVLFSPAGQEQPYGGQVLPGGEAMLVTVGAAPSAADAVKDPNPDSLTNTRVVLVSLKTGGHKTIIEHGEEARYLATGHIVYAEGDALLAVSFDPKRQQVIGESIPIVQGVRRSNATPTAQYSVSNTGTLVYVPGTTAQRQSLALIDRRGHTELLKASTAAYSLPRISPDGKQIAVEIDDGKSAQIWIYDVSGRASIRQLTLEGQQNRFPAWSADGQHVVFTSDRGGDLGIWKQRADGSGAAERITQPEKGESHAPLSWHPHEQTLLFVVGKPGATSGASLWTYSLSDRKARPFAGVTSTQNLGAQFSPDGRWVAYQAVGGFANGRGPSIFVRPYPVTDATVYPIASGTHPTWASDGTELFYQRAATLWVTRVTTRPSFATGEPVALPYVGAQTFWRNFDITPDGKLLGVVSPVEPGALGAPEIDVVLNWFEEVKRLVPVK